MLHFLIVHVDALFSQKENYLRELKSMYLGDIVKLHGLFWLFKIVS